MNPVIQDCCIDFLVWSNVPLLPAASCGPHWKLCYMMIFADDRTEDCAVGIIPFLNRTLI